MSDQGFWRLDHKGDLNNERLCFLDNFVDGLASQTWRVHVGEPLTALYPPDAKIFLAGDESGIKLSSLVGNSNSMLLVSKPLKELISEHVTTQIECLPVTIHDHRKRPLGRDYYIINPLGALDCLDMKASEIVYGKKDPTKIIRINEYVLAREKLAEAPELFRIEHARAKYVLGPKLAQAIGERSDITNIVREELPVTDAK